LRTAFWIRAIFCGALILVSSSHPVVAQTESLEKVGKQLADQANQTARSLLDVVGRAVDGDTTALRELISTYVIPAGVALLVLFIGYMVASFIGRVVGGLVTRKVDLTLGKFLNKVIKNLIMAMVVLGVLGKFNVDVTSFAALLAAAGFALGMALQGTLSSIAAGVMLLVFRPFRVDDYIVVAGTEGIVDEIDLFTTRLNSLDNRHLIIPNSQIFGTILENYSRNEYRRVDVSVSTSYSADLYATRLSLEEAAAAVAEKFGGGESQVYLNELGQSAINWSCRVWCRPKEYWQVREELTASVKTALDQAGIVIPFPQFDVNIAGKVLAKAAA